MKKINILFIIFFVLLLATGCTLSKKENESNTNNDITNNNSHIISSNSVVIYFSATNNTKKIANYIANNTNSNIIEIIPEEKYTSEDLNYNNEDCRANKEQNDDNARPKISNKMDLDKYDTIYLGFPIWWGKEPKIILSLLDSYNLEGKNIILFCTSGGSGIETSISNLKEYNDKLNIIDGKKFSSSSSEKDVKEWLETLNKGE